MRNENMNSSEHNELGPVLQGITSVSDNSSANTSFLDDSSGNTSSSGSDSGFV